MNKEEPRILIACPTYEGMKYCQKELLEALQNIDYENYDILLVDNSEHKRYYKELQTEEEINVEYLKMPQGMKGIKKIVRARNWIINYMLERDYDYVLMIDADVIVPPHIITKLLQAQKDIISGLYYNTFTIDGKNVERPVAWKKIEGTAYEEIKKQISDIETLEKAGTGIRRHLTKKEIESGTLQRVYIASAGSMLIKKEALQTGIRYGILETPHGGETSDDIQFFKEAEKQKIPVYCDTSILCEHLTEGKYRREGEKIVHPAYDT